MSRVGRERSVSTLRLFGQRECTRELGDLLVGGPLAALLEERLQRAG